MDAEAFHYAEEGCCAVVAEMCFVEMVEETQHHRGGLEPAGIEAGRPEMEKDLAEIEADYFGIEGVHFDIEGEDSLVQLKIDTGVVVAHKSGGWGNWVALRADLVDHTPVAVEIVEEAVVGTEAGVDCEEEVAVDRGVEADRANIEHCLVADPEDQARAVVSKFERQVEAGPSVSGLDLDRLERRLTLCTESPTGLGVLLPLPPAAASSAAFFALCSANRFFKSEGASNFGFFCAFPSAGPLPVAARRSASDCANCWSTR